MITPEEFPYIKSLRVNDCYAYQNFDIDLHDYKPFSHLILTGKNGSGKSTILNVIDNHSINLRVGNHPPSEIARYRNYLEARLLQLGEDDQVKNYRQTIFQWEAVMPFFKEDTSWQIWTKRNENIYSYFRAKRESKVDSVNTVTKEENFLNQLSDNNSPEYFVKQFKQYLVNKKIYQALGQIKNDKARFSEIELFFSQITNSFRQIFEDNTLTLVFQEENFDFLIQLSDGRQLTFDILSEGFSALLSILMDLLTRVDLIRKQVDDYSYNPCGIVLIDEPETHLHLQLQEQVLPLLTSLFPNVQFIAATHSPAVIASIRNATIFDLTTKESRISEDTAGRSYSELMMAHFGMDNEYSTIADELIRQIDSAVSELAHDPVALQKRLRTLYNEQGQLLSPTLKIKLELLIAQQEVQQAIAQ